MNKFLERVSLKKAVLLLSIFIFMFSVFAGQVYAATTSSLLPIADGTYAQWIPNAGIVHYTRVDESVCNGNTDLNSETTVGERDSYKLDISSVPSDAVITQIDVTPCASKNTSGGVNTTFNVFYRLNGVNSIDAGSYTLTATKPTSQSSTNFTGLSVVKNSTTTLEVGGVYTAGNRGVKLSRISTTVSYFIPAPNAPSNLVVTLDSPTQAVLVWQDNSRNENNFVIERSPDGISGWTQIGSTVTNIGYYHDATISPLIPYYYRVSAVNNSGNSGYSNVYGINTNIPNNPSNLVLTVTVFYCGAPDNQLLTWQDNAFNETGFELESSDGLTFVPLSFVGADVTTYSFVGEACNYRVRAFNSFGFSDWRDLDVIN